MDERKNTLGTIKCEREFILKWQSYGGGVEKLSLSYYLLFHSVVSYSCLIIFCRSFTFDHQTKWLTFEIRVNGIIQLTTSE